METLCNQRLAFFVPSKATTSMCRLKMIAYQILALIVVGATADIPETIHDFCQFETLNASCSDGSVVLMRSARYGRMRLGRCIDTDVYIDCSADVLSHMDARCSGRPSCAVTIPDSALHQQQPCPKDLMAYLETSYLCVPVDDSRSGACAQVNSGQSAADGTGKPKPHGYLSSYIAQQTGHGSSNCPWVIEVRPGQRIDLYVLDFSLGARYRTENKKTPIVESSAEYCHIFAMVTEGDRSREFTVCAGTEREKLTYSSLTNTLSIKLSSHVLTDHSINFMIKYLATGCADLVPPKNAWINRLNDRATVTCNFTSHTWHLVCKGDIWIGRDASECDKGPFTDKITHASSFPAYGLVMAVVIGVFIGAVCGFSLLAAVLWCKRRTETPPPPRRDVELMPTRLSELEQSCKVHQLQGEYGYTHVWEVSGNGATPIFPHPQQLHAPPGRFHVANFADSPYQTSMAAGAIGGPPTTFNFNPSKRPKEHIYESPTFDGTRVTRVAPPHPYFCQGTLHCTHAPQQTNDPNATLQKSTVEPAECSRYSLSEDTDDDDRYQLNFVKRPGYTQVDGSTSDPDVKNKPRAENHYT